MEVSLKLEEWKISRDENTRLIVGQYSIWSGSTKISSQQFNEKYSDVKLAFSTDLIAQVELLEERIQKEITGKLE